MPRSEGMGLAWLVLRKLLDTRGGGISCLRSRIGRRLSCSSRTTGDPDGSARAQGSIEVLCTAGTLFPSGPGRRLLTLVPNSWAAPQTGLWSCRTPMSHTPCTPPDPELESPQSVRNRPSLSPGAAGPRSRLPLTPALRHLLSHAQALDLLRPLPGPAMAPSSLLRVTWWTRPLRRQVGSAPGSAPGPAPPRPALSPPGSTPPAPEAPPLTVAAPQAVCPLWLRGASFGRELPAHVSLPGTPGLKAGSPQLEPRALLPSGSPSSGPADRRPLLSPVVSLWELLLFSL